jgi:hypothetical protein
MPLQRSVIDAVETVCSHDLNRSCFNNNWSSLYWDHDNKQLKQLLLRSREQTVSTASITDSCNGIYYRQLQRHLLRSWEQTVATASIEITRIDNWSSFYWDHDNRQLKQLLLRSWEQTVSTASITDSCNSIEAASIVYSGDLNRCRCNSLFSWSQ